MKIVEIRVRPVVRYVVTRFATTDAPVCGVGDVGSEQLGEFPNAAQANRVATALHGYEHEKALNAYHGEGHLDIRLNLADEG